MHAHVPRLLSRRLIVVVALLCLAQLENNAFLFRGAAAADSDNASEAADQPCRDVDAVIARSTAGLRRRLADAGVAFSCPLNDDLNDDDDDGYALPYRTNRLRFPVGCSREAFRV